jgi:hypothetical protein
VPLQVADDAFVRLHASPQALQLLVVFRVVHVVPPHRVSLQVHAPLVQSGCGCAHGAQFAPPVPQDVADCAEYASHTPPLQQPLGQEVASQTHCPVALLHSWPAGHAVHVAPPAPHDVLDSPDSGSQVLPLQQPAHAPPPQLHVPLEHVSPVPQALHAAPPLPHWLADWLAKSTQVLPLQHPFGQDVASQTHVPLLLLHSWYIGQAAHVAPPAPHEPVDSDAYASHVPLTPPLQQPAGHVLGSHAHVPVVRSHRPFAHEPQAAPPLPQSEPDSEA